MKLFYREMGKGRPLIILHGLFGSSDNWLSIGRQLSESRQVFLVDQRNHGQSPHGSTFSYEAMAQDLKAFIEEKGLASPDLMGHSMGGKTVMKYASLYPESLNAMIVVDISPRFYPVHHDVILEGLSAITLEDIKSRKEADEQLAAYVPELGVRQFLLKNLTRTKAGGFTWKINLPVIRDSIGAVGEGLPPETVMGRPALFIAGEKSSYIRPEDHGQIKRLFPHAEVLTVAGAGHWVHAEKPEEVIMLVEGFLGKVSS